MNTEYENTTVNRAMSNLHEIAAATFEYLEAGGGVVNEANFSTNWDGFAWTSKETDVCVTPFEAYLILNQVQAEEIDGVDNDSNWAWVEERTLAEQLGVTVDFINGMIDGCATPFVSVSDLLVRYNDNCAAGHAEYVGEDEVPYCCEDDDEFSLGVDMGQKLFAILNEAGVFT